MFFMKNIKNFLIDIASYSLGCLVYLIINFYYPTEINYIYYFIKTIWASVILYGLFEISPCYYLNEDDLSILRTACRSYPLFFSSIAVELESMILFTSYIVAMYYLLFLVLLFMRYLTIKSKNR